MTTIAPPPDTKVPETLEQIAKRLPKELYNIVCFSCSEAFCKHWQEDASDVILSALRDERETALRDAARLECIFCAGVDGFNPLPVEVEAGNYVHRNEPPNGQAGVYCKASRINALKDGNKDAD